MTTRDERQLAVLHWVADTFGVSTLTREERMRRFVEEAVELAQSEHLSREAVVAVVDHVYGKPPGDPSQEVGGVGVTLLAYCAVRGFSADAEEVREFERVRAIDPAHFRARHNAKAVAGIAAHTSGARVVHLSRVGSHICDRCGGPLVTGVVCADDLAEYEAIDGSKFVRCDQVAR